MYATLNKRDNWDSLWNDKSVFSADNNIFTCSEFLANRPQNPVGPLDWDGESPQARGVGWPFSQVSISLFLLKIKNSSDSCAEWILGQSIRNRSVSLFIRQWVLRESVLESLRLIPVLSSSLWLYNRNSFRHSEWVTIPSLELNPI